MLMRNDLKVLLVLLLQLLCILHNLKLKIAQWFHRKNHQVIS